MLAVDKDLTTAAAVQTHSNYGWWKAEFDKIRFIHKVVIYHKFYNNWFFSCSGVCYSSVSGFEKCVRNHNNVDVSVYQGEIKQRSCGTLKLTYGLEQSDQIYTLVCNIGGDAVKLSKTTGDIVISEVVIIGRGKLVLKVNEGIENRVESKIKKSSKVGKSLSLLFSTCDILSIKTRHRL